MPKIATMRVELKSLCKGRKKHLREYIFSMPANERLEFSAQSGRLSSQRSICSAPGRPMGEGVSIQVW